MASTQNQESRFKNWVYECLKVLKPPENLTVSEWADKYRILDDKTSSEPGQWATNRTPYLKQVMDSFNDTEIEEIIFCKPTQVGGTEALNNIVSYIVAQDQAPTLIVYPTLDLAKFTSKLRLQPMFKLSRATREHFKENQSKQLELHFSGMYISLVGANSASDLSSRPIQYLLYDEIDKFPVTMGKEADPISLAKERTATFVNNKKIFYPCTPTTKDGYIWQAMENADTIYNYFVPCPHCNHYQTFKFREGIKFNSKLKSRQEIADSAYYECESCKGIILDNHKAKMLASGEWRAIKSEGKRKVAFHINAIYSPWRRFSDVVSMFLEAKAEPDKLQNFVNSWLAEPWVVKEVELDHAIVKERESEFEEGIVPNDAILLTAGVDVQKNKFYYTIRAWGPYYTSWNVTHGEAETWEDIEYILNLPYNKLNGESYQVSLGCIDSGNDTETVYDICALNNDWLKPVKGSSRPLSKRFNISAIDKTGSKADGLNLYIVDTGQYKDTISARLGRENGRGAWMAFKNVDEDYCKQITAEHKIKIKKGEQVIYKWVPKPGKPNNHYLDCEVYAAVAGDLMQVRFLTDANTQVKQTKSQDEAQNSSGWLSKKPWLETKEGWI